MTRTLILASILIFSLFSYAEEEKVGLENETALGYVVTGGNSESETTSLKHRTTYNWTRDVLQLTGHYIQTSGVDTETDTKNVTAENWAATLRYEKVFEPKWFNGFVSHGWRGDRFQGVQYGHDTDIGVKYFTANSEKYKQFFEVGYRYTREDLVVPDTQAEIDEYKENRVGVGNLFYPEYHYARLYAQADYTYSKSFSLGAWVEYLPSVTNFSNDQRLNYSPYLTSVLTDIFSLKVAYEGRYRYKLAPGATKYTDFTFTTALIAKF